MPMPVLNTRTCPDPGPVANLGHSQVNFGNVVVGTSSTLTETFQNTGDAALDISEITVGSPYYTQTNTCGSVVAAGTSCTFTLTFSPTKTGTHNSNIQIQDNAWTTPQFYYVYGTGVTAAQGADPNAPAQGQIHNHQPDNDHDADD